MRRYAAALSVLCLAACAEVPRQGIPEEISAKPADVCAAPVIIEPRNYDPDLEGQKANEPPDPEGPIPIDFVQKDINTVMHYIWLRRGLAITIGPDVELTAELLALMRTMAPLAALELFARRHGYLVTINGPFIYISNPHPRPTADIWAGHEPGRFDVCFTQMNFVNAVMQTASFTKTEVAVPAICFVDGKSAVPVRVDLEMYNATAEEIFRELARLAGATMVRDSKSSGWLFSNPAE